MPIHVFNKAAVSHAAFWHRAPPATYAAGDAALGRRERGRPNLRRLALWSSSAIFSASLGLLLRQSTETPSLLEIVTPALPQSLQKPTEKMGFG